MSDPLVTVVIPCHNHLEWVNLAIDSVVSQDYPNKRIVVVDDGSTDGSFRAVVERLKDAKVVRHAGEPEVWSGTAQVRGQGDTLVLACRFTQAYGPASARNYGIQAGWEDTDVFMFLDSDDEYLPGKMARSVARWAEASQHIGAVYSDYDTLNPATGLRLRQYKEPFSRARLLQECLPNMNSLVSKQALEQCGVLDETLRTCEDYDLWLRISEKFILVHLPEPLLLLRVGDHSSTATVARENWQRNWQKVMAKVRARASGHA